MLYTVCRQGLSDMVPAAGMMAQVLLAGSLSRDAEPRCDLRPSNALTDGSLDKDRQLSFSLVSLDPDVLDLLQQVRSRQSSRSLRRARLTSRLLSASSWWHASGSRCRLALRSAHAASMRAATDISVLRIPSPASACDLDHIVTDALPTGWTLTVFYGRLRSYAVAGERAGASCMDPVPAAQWLAGGEGMSKAPG